MAKTTHDQQLHVLLLQKRQHLVTLRVSLPILEDAHVHENGQEGNRGDVHTSAEEIIGAEIRAGVTFGAAAVPGEVPGAEEAM